MSWSVVYMIVIFPLLVMALLALDLIDPQGERSDAPRDRDQNFYQG